MTCTLAAPARAAMPAADTVARGYSITVNQDTGWLRLSPASLHDSTIPVTGNITLSATDYRFSGRFANGLFKGSVVKPLDYGEEPKGELSFEFHNDSLYGQWDSSITSGGAIAGQPEICYMRYAITGRGEGAFVEYPQFSLPALRIHNAVISALAAPHDGELDSAVISADYASPSLLVLHVRRDYFREHGKAIGTVTPKYPETAFEELVFSSGKKGRRQQSAGEIARTNPACREFIDSVLTSKRSSSFGDMNYFIRALPGRMEFGIHGKLEPYMEPSYTVPTALDCRPETLLHR